METLKLGQRYAIAMLDVDHFKKFNDTYGHDIGDQVLRMVAGQMARVGGGGKPFRYGGEEFTIIFPGKTAEEAIANLDALRQVIKESGFTIRAKDRLQAKASTKRNGKGKRVSVTISIGVSERSEKNPTPEDVTKAADQALYRAKKGGRNRVSK
jgi:diguanylate cyclase (GGDEF)-like protein